MYWFYEIKGPYIYFRTSSVPAHQSCSLVEREGLDHKLSLHAGGTTDDGALLADCWGVQEPFGILGWLAGCRVSGNLQAEETRHSLSPTHSSCGKVTRQGTNIISSLCFFCMRYFWASRWRRVSSTGLAEASQKLICWGGRMISGYI